MAKILFARVDRIGDLVLTLPIETNWRQYRPQDEVGWLMNRNLKFVMEARTSKVESSLVRYVGNPHGFIQCIRESAKIARELRADGFTTVVAFHVPWWVSFAFFLARIPTRVGVASQWFSWFFFNKRLRQKRSQALQHEAQYNLDLARFALGDGIGAGAGAGAGAGTIDLQSEISPTSLKPEPAQISKWKEILKQQSWVGAKYVVIHPGMAGSALNWPPLRYRELVELLQSKNKNIVITGGPTDRAFIEKTGIRKVNGVLDLVEQTNPELLLAVLSGSACVIAPSTGVAHLAASLGVPVAGIYSPVKVQAPKRWAPMGRQVKVFVPDVHCPAQFRCLESKCSFWDCMEEIPVESVFSYAMEYL